MSSEEERWLTAGALIVLALAVVDLALGPDVSFTSSYFIGAMVAAAAVRPARVAPVGLFAVVATITVSAVEGSTRGQLLARGLVALGSAGFAVFVARQRQRSERKLIAVETVAEVAQRAILRSLPAKVGPVAFAARYESAEAGARVGGDLYEVVDSDWGVRLLVGDVGGHGLPAVRVAASALGSFREMAFSLRDPVDIARLLDRRLGPQLGEEGLVTAVITEFREDGTVVFVNCGHPWPLLVRHRRATGALAAQVDPAPPIGLAPSPVAVRLTLEPGDRLLFYTDGLIEAHTRLARGIDVESFAPIVSRGGLEQSMAAILRKLDQMVDGRLEDDLALVLAEYAADG